MLLSGTAGAQNAAVNVGDVVLSGYVVDKSSIHYQLGGYQTPYNGIEIHLTDHSDIAGAVVGRVAKPYPTPGMRLPTGQDLPPPTRNGPSSKPSPAPKMR